MKNKFLLFLLSFVMIYHESFSKSFYNFEDHKQTNSEIDISGVYFYGLLSSVLAFKIGYDFSWQIEYKNFIDKKFKDFAHYTSIKNIQTILNENLYNFFKQEDIETIISYEDVIRNSYNSWIKPWEWNLIQQENYRKIEVLSIFVLYGPLIKVDSDYQAKDIIKYARQTCSLHSKYPLVYYASALEAHREFLSKNNLIGIDKKITKLLDGLKEHLLNLRLALTSDREYLEEFYMFRTEMLLDQIKMMHHF